jgi:hypothetical protein
VAKPPIVLSSALDEYTLADVLGEGGAARFAPEEQATAVETREGQRSPRCPLERKSSSALHSAQIPISARVGGVPSDDTRALVPSPRAPVFFAELESNSPHLRSVRTSISVANLTSSVSFTCRAYAAIDSKLRIFSSHT